MKETKLAQILVESDREAGLIPQSPDVTLLNDLELALVGGGDTPVDWP
jgi:hypothetical protein